MCHHYEYGAIDELTGAEREELLQTHSDEELEAELEEDELEAIKATV